jgi:hypothetical protein
MFTSPKIMAQVVSVFNIVPANMDNNELLESSDLTLRVSHLRPGSFQTLINLQLAARS